MIRKSGKNYTAGWANPGRNSKDRVAFLFFGFFLLSVIYCADYFTAPGPQPGYIDKKIEHEPKLSVFGVLRPDSTAQGLPQSFIKLEPSFPFDDYPDGNEVIDAHVRLLKRGENFSTETVQFIYTDLGSFPDTLFRNQEFYPVAGENYALYCERPGYPVLTAETTVPGEPRIVEGSLSESDQSLHFEILRDEAAGLVEVILLGENYYDSRRFVRPETGNFFVSMELKEGSGGPSFCYIYLYDLNLAEYLSANLSIKPNVYQSDFSTVQNGYGCFGSLNLKEIDLRNID